MKRSLPAQLIEIGRKLWERGLIAGADGNLSARSGRDRILATVSGVAKGAMEERHLIELSLDGTVLSRSRFKPSSEIKMHLEVYRRRPEINAVCHAHPPHATAFATAGLGLTDCVIPEIVVALGAVPLASYATPSTEEVPRAVAEKIAGADAILLENHGALTVGKDIEEAYLRMESVEHAARILILARGLGGPRKLSPEEAERLYRTRETLGLTNPAPGCRAG
jgi:L-fuculose-phosphate aldolase